MAELKPCPFCGGKDLKVDYQIENNSPTTFYVVCMNCFAQGPFHYTEKISIAAWNKRS